MPELPEVETVCRGLRAHIIGRRIVRAELRRPDLRFPFPHGLQEGLEGSTIKNITRRAKYILIELGNHPSHDLMQRNRVVGHDDEAFECQRFPPDHFEPPSAIRLTEARSE